MTLLSSLGAGGVLVVEVEVELEVEVEVERVVFGESEGGGGGCELVPVAETRDAFAEIAARLVLGVDDGSDVYLGQGARNDAPKVVDEGIVPAKGRIIPLFSVVRDASRSYTEYI